MGKYKGVHFVSKSGKYLAQINLGGKNRFIGNYEDEREASKIREEIHNFKVKYGDDRALKKLTKLKESRQKLKKNTKKQVSKKRVKEKSKRRAVKTVKKSPGIQKKTNLKESEVEEMKIEENEETEETDSEDEMILDMQQSKCVEEKILKLKTTALLLEEEISDEFASWLLSFGEKVKKDPFEHMLKNGKRFLKAMKIRFEEVKHCKNKKYAKAYEKEKKHREVLMKKRTQECLDALVGTYGKMDSSWSNNQKACWKKRKTAPCGFFYRHSKESEPRKDKYYPWTDEEYKSYMESLKIFGANYAWGLFSFNVAGRCGYVCSNKYRDFLKAGMIYEPNYTCCAFPKMISSYAKDGKFVDKVKKYFSFIILEDPSGTLETPWCHPLASTKTKNECFLSSVKQKAFEKCHENAIST